MALAESYEGVGCEFFWANEHPYVVLERVSETILVVEGFLLTGVDALAG